MLYNLSKSELRQLRKNPLNPHFTGAEMLLAVYRTDRDAVLKILPKPLRPPEDPIAVAFVAHYPETNFGCVYNEGALFVQATFKGKKGLYCLSMPVDDDMALIGGRERFGFPKKMAEQIELRREDEGVVGRVIRKGVEILRIAFEPTEPLSLARLGKVSPITKDADGTACAQAISYLFKYQPSPDGLGFDYLPRLVRQVTLLRPRADVMSGMGEVQVTSSPYDPLGEVPVRDVLLCAHGTWDNTMLPGFVVTRAWNVWRFAHHAFFKVDTVPVLLGWDTNRDPASNASASSPRQAESTPQIPVHGRGSAEQHQSGRPRHH